MFSLLFLVYQLYRHLDLSTYSPPSSSVAIQSTIVNTSVIPTFIPTSTPTPTTPLPTKTLSTTPTSNPTGMTVPTPLPTPTILIEKEMSPIIDEPPKQSENNSLLTAVNAFRSEQQKQQVQSHAVLCRIANERLQAVIKRSSLDNHEGLQGYKEEIAQHFSQWGEVIFFSDPPKSPSNVVTQGWANSSSHKDTLLTQEFTNGCGGDANGFAVFLLGKKK